MPAAHRKWIRPAVWAFYVVIGLEFLFMISPFALYFYSSYGDVLNVLHRWPATAWLTGFFLPHVSQTASPWLEALKPWGFRVAAFGLLFFLVGVVQIYGAKLLRRPAVTGGVYRISRHPQYVALALLGLGLLAVWPRFLVLLAYVTMLFLYFLLARWEERRCLETYGEPYREYLDRMGTLGPRRLTSWLPRPPAWARRPLAVGGLYLLALVAAVAAAQALRSYSLHRVSTYYAGAAAVLSPAPLEASELAEAYELARAHPDVQARLDGAAGGAGSPLLVYVVPESWYLADLPLEAWHEVPPEHRRGHTTPRDFERGRYKVLVTRALTHHPEARGRDIVIRSHGREPLVRVRVDLDQDRVTAVETPPDSVVWGDIPTPLF